MSIFLSFNHLKGIMKTCNKKNVSTDNKSGFVVKPGNVHLMYIYDSSGEKAVEVNRKQSLESTKKYHYAYSF